jgi:AcrR family transcriptional regulator
MSTPRIARGNATRQANKELRRQRILDIARDLIATRGLDDFTLKELATRADVSLPTIHNLFGKKYDIFEELCSEMVVRVDTVLSNPDMNDPIEASEAFIDNLLELFRQDEAFYRAAFVAGEKTGLFEHDPKSGIFAKSLQIAVAMCQRAKENGYLQGRVDTHCLAEHLFGSQRLARQDWVAGYIDLDRYRSQVLLGMCLIFAADATPDFHRRLRGTINELNRNSPGHRAGFKGSQ